MPPKKIPQTVLKRYMPKYGFKWVEGIPRVMDAKRKDYRVICALQALNVRLRNREVQIELCGLFEAAVEFVKVKAASDSDPDVTLWEVLNEFHDHHRLGRRLTLGTLISLMRAIYAVRVRWQLDGKQRGMQEHPDRVPPLARLVDELDGAWRQFTKAKLDVYDWDRAEDFEWVESDSESDSDNRRSSSQASAAATAANITTIMASMADPTDPAYVALADGVVKMNLGQVGDRMDVD
ncbi:hypothetical protein VTJ49DRAFT_7013 [Mycothermus thermophilus]|uniref:Uncharacterized protein n=1 Tax=Humicola insolens TaxID=85995 RepID=A0ABR3VJA0_HUMIN